VQKPIPTDGLLSVREELFVFSAHEDAEDSAHIQKCEAEFVDRWARRGDQLASRRTGGSGASSNEGMTRGPNDVSPLTVFEVSSD
jgi:hypothetical protein